MNLRNSKGIRLRSFYFTSVWRLFSKIFIRSGKCIMLNSIQVLPNQGNRSVRLKILTNESPMRSYIKNRVKLRKLIQF